jgi:hypothetical protein
MLKIAHSDKLNPKVRNSGFEYYKLKPDPDPQAYDVTLVSRTMRFMRMLQMVVIAYFEFTISNLALSKQIYFQKRKLNINQGTRTVRYSVNKIITS